MNNFDIKYVYYLPRAAIKHTDSRVALLLFQKSRSI